MLAVIVTSIPAMVHDPVASNVSVRRPPTALTGKLEPLGADGGAPMTVSAACGALLAVTMTAGLVIGRKLVSPAFVAVIEQLPVPLVIVIVSPPATFEHGAPAANVTRPVPSPPIAVTWKDARYWALGGALTLSAGCCALATLMNTVAVALK